MDHFKFGKNLFISLFIIGTVLLLLFSISLSPGIASLGYLFIVLAVLASWIYIAVVLFNLVMGKISTTTTLKTIGVLLLNVPVGMLYVWIVMLLMNYARITFTNTTDTDLVLIKIEGCEEIELRDLHKGESETVWIKIPGDCHVDIEYEINGLTKHETAVSYLTHANGIIATYEIGSNRDVLKDL